MNDTWVTLQGWVGADVESREAAGVPVASFRIGSTPRYLKNGEWVDGATSWFTVKAWRALARNVAESVHKGDPVVVHGRLRAESWEREGQPTSVTHVVDATVVGHDLTRGVSDFQRSARRDRTDPGVPGGTEDEPAPAGEAAASTTPGPGAIPEQRRSPEAAA